MRRKIYSFLTALAALLFALPAQATWVLTGGEDAEAIPAASVEIGKYYLIEGASSSGTLGHYLAQNGRSLTTTIDSSCVWTLEDAGKNAVTGEQQYYVRTLKGYYLGNAFNTTTDKNTALTLLLHSCKSDPVSAGGETLNFGSDGSSTSWDANSTTIATLTTNDGKSTVTFLTNDDAMAWLFGSITVQAGTGRNKNQWDLRAVEWEVNLQADLQEAIDEVDSRNYLSYYHSAMNPYSVTDSAYNALQAAYTAAQTAVGETHTNAEYQAHIDALRAAVTAFTGDLVPMTDGYYYLQSASSRYTVNLGLYAQGGRVRWNTIGTADTARYIWHFTETDGGYYAQNMGDASYIYGPTGTSGDALLLSTTNDAQRPVGITYRGQSQVSLQSVGYNGAMRYFGMNGANGTTTSGDASVSSFQLNEATAWRLVKVTDTALVARLERQLAQTALNAEFAANLQQAEDLYYSNQPAYQPTGNKLVTAATQITTNNPEQSEGTTANGGGYEGLLDGDLNTYYHAAWNGASETDQNYNYIQVHLESGLPTNVAIWWARRISNNNNRPTSLLIQTSTDGQDWTTVRTLSNPEGRFPTLAADTFYTSPNITLPEGQTYLRLSVLHTAPLDRCVVEPYPYFTMSEFNLYPGSEQVFQPNETQAARADVRPAYDALQAAIPTARQVDATRATQADIDALQEAIDGLNAVLADTTKITTALRTANNALNTAEVGTEMLQYPQAAFDALGTTVDEAEAAAPYYNLTRSSVDSLAAAIDQAVAAFNAAIVLPANGIYYVVSNASEASRPEASLPTRGRVMYAQTTSQSSMVYWGGLPEDNVTNARAGWLLEAQGNGTFTMRNVATGTYWNAPANMGMLTLSTEPTPYVFVRLGSGEFGLRPAAGGVLLDAYWGNHGVFAYESDGTSGGSPCSWTVQAVDPQEFNDLRTFQANRSYIVTSHYSTYELPLDVNGLADVRFYDVTGAVKNGQNAVTALNLTRRQTGLKAGEPVIMTISLPDSANVTLSMQLEVENPVLACGEAAQSNGLQGTFSSLQLDTTGLAYFVGTTDTLQVTQKGSAVTISRLEGYVNPVRVANIEGATTDLVVPIAGDGIINAIRTTRLADPQAPVNVYSIDGVLLRKQVPAARATQGLAKGLYIVAGQKVLVK